MKKKLFKTAWTIYRATTKNFSESLKLAWRKIKLEKRLTEKTLKFAFRKKNGEIRNAIGQNISKENYTFKNSGRTSPLSIVKYFDVEKQAIRSFQIWQLI